MNWNTLINSSRELTVRPRNTRIYARIEAVGTKGQQATSKILFRIVQ